MTESKNENLRQFTAIICNKKPYAVMGLDTIGKDEEREIFHAVVQKFVYDNTTNQYGMENRLELMQKCSKSIPQNDLKRFGIMDTYTASALDSMDFSKKLTAFVVEELDDVMLIVNGNDSVVNSLTKVKGCESLYADKAEQGLALNSTDLLGNYLKGHDASGNTPRAYLKYMKSENIKAVTCDEKIAVFSLFAEQCRAEYGLSTEKIAPAMETPSVQENSFKNELSELADATENEFDHLLKEFSPEVLKKELPVVEMPSDRRIQHIEMHFTPEQQAVIDALEKQEEQAREAWSERGKKAYRDGTVKQKLDILERSKIVADKLEDMTDLQEMYQMLDRESGDNGKNNGFTVLQAGTTGLQAGNRVTQIAFATYDIDETGKAGFTKIAGFSRLVYADMEYIQKAEQIAQSGNFDAFAHGGIDVEKYKKLCEAGVSNKAENFCTVSTLSNTIAKYFEAYPVSQYPIVSAGMSTKKMDIPEELKGKVSYSQGALLQSVNNENLTAEPIDFTQVIKEYTAIVRSEPEYNSENVLFPDKTLPDNLKNFGLDAIAKQNGRDITGAAAKCEFMADMIKKIQEQHLAIEQVKNQQKEAETIAVQKKETLEFQEESFPKPEYSWENSELFHHSSYPDNSLQFPTQPKGDTWNQKIASLRETAQKFTEQMAESAPAEHTDRIYDNLNKVIYAMSETSATVQKLSQGLTVQNENNSHTNENMEQLIATLGTMITTLQTNMQIQKEENKAVISMLEEQIKVQKEENTKLLHTMERKDELHREQMNQVLSAVKQLAEVAVQTQGQFINVNERLAQTQEQNVSMMENQNTYAKTTNTLVQEVAAVKADGADTRESLVAFKEETKESFDRTNQTLVQHSAVLGHHETAIENVKAETRENKAEIRRISVEFSEKINQVAKNSAVMAQIAKNQSNQLETLCANQNELASGFIEMHDRVTGMDTKVEQLYAEYAYSRPEHSERY